MWGDSLRLLADFLQFPRKITGKAAYLPVEALMTIVGRTTEVPLRRWIAVAVGLATAGSAGAQGQGTEFLASDRVGVAGLGGQAGRVPIVLNLEQGSTGQ